MKRMYLFTLWIFSIGLLQAQIGINTENPQSLLHIDSQGNNSTSAINKNKDDVVITTNGDIGIGTITPKAKVHIVSDGTTPPLRLQDGNEAAKKILISDDNGVGTWGEAGLSSFGTIPYEQNTRLTTNSTLLLYDTGLKFEFPSTGVYSVSLGVRIHINIPNYERITWAQLLPALGPDLIAIWQGGSPRFKGSYEVPANSTRAIDGGTEVLFKFNQSITVEENYKTMYLVIQTSLWSTLQTVKVSWGTSSTSLTPEGRPSYEVGGSYIKIK